MSRLIPIFFLIALLAVASSGAVLSPMAYWKKVLPTTSIPDALMSFLPKGSGPRYGGQWVRKPGDFFQRYQRYLRRYQHYQHVDKMESPPKGFFFFEESLKPGTAMDIKFLVANINSDQQMPTFLPRQVAEGLPFSTSSFPTILRRFSLTAASPEASTMKETLEDCESPNMRGETKHCATSLESMVDFATTQLGSNNLNVLSTLVHKTKQQVDRSYTVQPGIVKMDSSNAVACHPEAYAYAVFYCHKIIDTRTYVVPLMDAEDRSRVDAVAVCHADTSQWDPEHPSFKMLGVKPGTVPICHFLPHNNFLWISK